MSKSQIVSAIDIGTNKIVAIVGNKDELGKIRILGYGEVPAKGIVRGAVQNIGVVASAINEAVRKCKTMAKDVPFRNVYVGMSGQNIRTAMYSRSKYIAKGEISKEDVSQLTDEVYNLNKEPGEEIIHVIPKSYSVDNLNIGLSPVGFSGHNLEGEFLVIFGNVNLSKAIRQAVTTSGLNIAKLIYKPIASAEAVLSPEDKEVGTLVADLGAGTTEVAIYHDRVLKATSTIPFGGNSITADIKAACQIVQRQAELLKVKHASALPLAGDAKMVITIKGLDGRNNKEISLMDLSNVTSARLDEIIAGIDYILCNSGCLNDISEIVLTGGGAKLANITQLVKFRLGREVRIGRFRDFSEEGPHLDGLEYSTVYGILIKGFEYEQVNAQMRAEASRQEAAKSTAATVSDTKADTDKAGADTVKKKGFFDKAKSWISNLGGSFFEDSDNSQKM